MWNDFKRPVTIISLIIGIVGVVLTINANKTRKVSYQFMNPISRIFDSSNLTSSIHISTVDSIPIIQDVWLFKGTIWNSGDLSVEKTDVMSPLAISVHDSLRIIDFKITRQEDPETSQFTLTKESDHLLRVDWKYFEPDYGFEYQLILVGDLANINREVSGVTIKGNIKGGNKLERYYILMGLISYLTSLSILLLLW